jgi:hypothetical protein
MPEEFVEVKRTLQEIIAAEIDAHPSRYALDIISSFQKGDAAGIKVVMQALEEEKYKEDNKFPINDERLKEIICACADRIRKPI